jgi:hypothetical protein
MYLQIRIRLSNHGLESWAGSQIIVPGEKAEGFANAEKLSRLGTCGFYWRRLAR